MVCGNSVSLIGLFARNQRIHRRIFSVHYRNKSTVFSETHERVAVNVKVEYFGSLGLKLSNEKASAHEHIPLRAV